MSSDAGGDDGVDAPAQVDGAEIDAPVTFPDLQGNYTYIKASNPNTGDDFGISTAISADGHTLAIGAFYEQSNGTSETDNSLTAAGAVYVFANSGGTWQQQAYLKASNVGMGDQFGASVALSGDGNTLVVGAPNEASCAIGLNGTQADGCGGAGAAYLFTRSGTTWTQQTYLKASYAAYNFGYGRHFGQAAAISTDGLTMAIGAPGDDSAATGVNGDQSNTSDALAGAVYVFTWSGTAWSQQAYVKASNTGAYDVFGSSVALSANGNVLAVGAPAESSGASGVNGNQLDNSVMEAGAVYTYKRSGTTWMFDKYIKASNPDRSDFFGRSVAVSGAGTTLAVGANGESSASAGINGDQTDNTQLQAGAVYVFAQSGSTWAQEAYVKSARPYNGNAFGMSVSLSGDGNTLATAAPGESSPGTGLTTPMSGNGVANSGAAYVFRRMTGTWAQAFYLKATNPGPQDSFGFSVSLTPDAATLVVAAQNEDSAAPGINGNQQDDTAMNAGAVYVIR